MTNSDQLRISHETHFKPDLAKDLKHKARFHCHQTLFDKDTLSLIDSCNDTILILSVGKVA